ncbi:hypothetical protein B9G98_04722 [Wickerhamiella sorbophila]|uniref:Uncharacterized protein n=1 Tax=Wickerhamiella sorbophila TaxID=45607 RepID=A0A2T0FQ34_9ASCO|nr:hypothetical protein B9G98_04722 [Wickerhamiella sorbophila]PRT57102.1 hypothetical protein B9G98_04722 [Wickerhamiella sorbophila]
MESEVEPQVWTDERLNYRPVLSGPNVLFMSSIENKAIIVSEMMLEVDNQVLRLGSLVTAACIAGQNIVLVFASGELKVYSLDLRVIASRQVAIPGEWTLACPPLLAANRNGSYIAIGLLGGALVLYSFDKVLKAVGTLRLPPMVKAVNLITLPVNKLPIIWTFSSCTENNSSYVKLEPSPLSTGEFVAIRLPLQGAPSTAAALDSKDGESIAIYEDQVRYFSMQDIISGRTALKTFSIGKTTAWSVGGGKAYFIAKSTLYSLDVFDGKANMDFVLTDTHVVDLGQINKFAVVSKQGKLVVSYCTDLERGSFVIENDEIKDRKTLSWFYSGFQFNGKSSKLITTIKQAPGLAVIYQASSANIVAEYKENCPPFLTGLNYIEDAQLLFVSSVSTCWMYTVKNGQLKLAGSFDEPVITAGLVHGSVIMITATKAVALSQFAPFKSIVQQVYPISQAHIGFEICTVILDSNEVFVLNPELVEAPRKLDTSGRMVYFVKALDTNTIAVGFEHELRLYDAELFEVKKVIQVNDPAVDCIMSNELVFATTDGSVYMGSSRQHTSGGPVALLSANQKYTLIKTDRLYKVDHSGVIPIHFGQKAVPDRVKSVCKISETDFMVGLDDTLLRIRLDDMPTSVIPRTHFVPTHYSVRQFAQAPHVRAIFVLCNGQILGYDSKYYEPLVLCGLPGELSQEENPRLIHMWNIALSGQKYHHLIVHSGSETSAVIRTYTITRRRQTVTFVARMKKHLKRPIRELTTGPTSILFTESRKPTFLRVLKIEESDSGLKLGDKMSYEQEFVINAIATSGSTVFFAGTNSLLGFREIDFDCSGPVWAIEYPPVKFEHCVVRATPKETFLVLSTDKPELIIFKQMAAHQYKLYQVMWIPHPAAEMRLNHGGTLLVLLKNSDIIEISVSNNVSSVFTIY